MPKTQSTVLSLVLMQFSSLARAVAHLQIKSSKSEMKHMIFEPGLALAKSRMHEYGTILGKAEDINGPALRQLRRTVKEIKDDKECKQNEEICRLCDEIIAARRGKR